MWSVQVSLQPDYDGWMEAWISCALQGRQREVKEEVCLPRDRFHGVSGSGIEAEHTFISEFVVARPS